MRRGFVTRVLFGAGTVTTMVVLRAAVAFAQSYPGGGQTPPPVVKGKQFFKAPRPANTGTNILLFLLLAILALAIGLFLYRISRRRAADDAA
jgi:LPXTG-motif cell wall-anchored protein